LAGALVALTVVAIGCGAEKTTTVLESPPVPTPASTPAPAERKLPPMTDPSRRAPVTAPTAGGDVTGGGQVTGGGPAAGDPAAVARINAQYPQVPGDYILTDADALGYIGRLGGLFPELNVVMSRLTTVGKCAIEFGLVGARAYLTPDYSQAGAIVVVSRNQAGRLPSIAARCLVSEVLNGGPGTSGGFQPCFSSYSIDDTVDGVVDRYYIFTGGTNGAWCDLVRDFHKNFNPQPIRF
jgi:hypothetical protein